MRFWSILVLLLLVLPARVFAVPVPAGEDMDQNVEEPDAPDADDGLEHPKNALPPLSAVPSSQKLPKGKAKAEQILNEGDYNSVTLRVLNKVTARTQTVDAAIGSVVRSGTIEIIAHRCWKSAPEESPENAALLEISEVKHGEPPAQIFLGWMFSSSPGLSALEDPFYDVTVVKCGKAG